MAALSEKGSPLDWACCGSTCVAAVDEQDSLESESRRADSHDDTKADYSATIPRHPIFASSADTLTLTRNSACSSTFRDDDDDELYDVIADLLGSSKLAADAANLGDRIVLSMGHGGARSNTYKSDQKDSKSSESKSTASSSSLESPTMDGAGDNTSPRRSAGQSHIPYWIGMSEMKENPKLLKVPSKKMSTKINNSLKKPLKTFLYKLNKKKTRSPPSDISTASSAFSSLGFCSAWAK